MIKKVILLAVLLVALAFGSAFAYEIDSLGSGAIGEVQPPTRVFVNPGGTGDVLLYGYYNVRGDQTLFSVTNTDSEFGARVRIRFREAATINVPASAGCVNGSQEVLDFDICLSRNDVWSGRIVDSAAGATLKSDDNDTGIQICDGDTAACNGTFAAMFPGGQAFKAAGNITVDQTKEGYFEVIAEQQLSENCIGVAGDGKSNTTCTCGNLIDTSILNCGDPSGCGDDVGNVLMGHAYIVNLSDTTTFAYAATALGDFAIGDVTPAPLFGSNLPNLRDDSENPGDITPVNYALTKTNLYAIYDLESNIGAKADLIVTFPTKWATHGETTTTPDCTALNFPTNADDIFDDTSVLVKIFDDAENAPEESCQFSPCQPGETKLPHEVNVIDLNGSGIFTSDVLVPLTTAFQFGWINIDLTQNGIGGPAPAHVTPFVGTLNGFISDGLPAIGYAVEKFAGGKFSGLIPLQYSSNASID